MKFKKEIMKIVLMVGLIGSLSCAKEKGLATLQDVGYTIDTTYTKGVDLSANLESLDASKLSEYKEGLRDLDFKNGALLYTPTEGVLIQDVILNFGYTNVNPVWDVRQWASKLTLSNSALEISTNGDRSYINAAKTLGFNPDGSFKLELRGKYEFGSTVRKEKESWPHLYLSQAIYPNVEIPIAGCSSIFFSLDAIREYCHNYMGNTMNSSLHTAHVVVNLIIQNRNKQSSLHGKYFTFQLPVYDYRYAFGKGINRYDVDGKEVVTGALMFGPAGDEVWDGTFKDGKWHKMRKDILPMILDAWPIATKEGSPLEGANMNDFYLASSTIGWEVPGTFNASMRFKNYSIKYLLKEN